MAARRYWLVKSEPESFSFDDLLACEDQRTAWDGVRNYQARNTLRDSMQSGDGVLFYHSNAQPPCIVGLAEVASGPYPDATQFDPASDYFDPGATRDDPRWILVDIRATARLERPLELEELKRNPKLDAMELLRKGSRLSVQPVTAEQWREVLAMAKRKAPKPTK